MSNDKIVVPIPSSFVKKDLKLYVDSGNGESKLFISSINKKDELDLFFENFSDLNKYYFSRENLIDYLKFSKIEYLANKCNKYKNVNENYYNDKVNFVNSLDEYITFDILKFEDKARYYIRATENSKKTFDSILREIVLPKISNLEIIKDKNNFLFNLVLNYEEIKKTTSETKNDKQIDYNSSFIDKPHQRIFFGAPGTGKSFKLNEEAKEYFGDNYERVTFHPNYMYGNLVGAFKPFPNILKNIDGSIKKDEDGNIQESITYKYIPGVLMKQLVKALKNPSENYLLLIEEINRANVSAVFGDIFQLLDRAGDGESEYVIATSDELQNYLKQELENVELSQDIQEKLGVDFKRLYLPKNLYIWATMNSADQGVMPMDTAFRRRWEFTYLDIDETADVNREDFSKYKFKVNKQEIVLWDAFRREVNKKLSALNIPEDKLIGPYFISKSMLEKTDLDELTEIIKNKVLMYLYEDVAKAYRPALFAEGKYATYSMVCRNFEENALHLFKGSLSIETEIIEHMVDNDM